MNTNANIYRFPRIASMSEVAREADEAAVYAGDDPYLVDCATGSARIVETETGQVEEHEAHADWLASIDGITAGELIEALADQAAAEDALIAARLAADELARAEAKRAAAEEAARKRAARLEQMTTGQKLQFSAYLRNVTENKHGGTSAMAGAGRGGETL